MLILVGWSWLEMTKLRPTERWSTATTVKLNEWRIRSDLQEYPPMAIARSARCLTRTKDKRRTFTEAEIDARADKDEADTAEGPTDMPGGVIEDGGEDATMAL